MAVAPHITGRFLRLVPGRLIAQTWRASNWKKSDADSILVLSMSPARRGARLEMVHANVPAANAKSISGGWRAYYWKPWQAYLAKKARRR